MGGRISNGVGYVDDLLLFSPENPLAFAQMISVIFMY
jgi:hypothetical protein